MCGTESSLLVLQCVLQLAPSCFAICTTTCGRVAYCFVVFEVRRAQELDIYCKNCPNDNDKFRHSSPYSSIGPKGNVEGLVLEIIAWSTSCDNFSHN